MSTTIHLVVIQGADKGKEISVPPEGARLGRSSKSDIVLSDPLLSRHHCRFSFKTNDGLWVADLASANQTLVNNKPVQETRLHVNDLVSVGDTVMRVLSDGAQGVATSSGTAETPPAQPQQGKPAATPVEPPIVDLGLIVDKEKPRFKLGAKPLIAILAAVVVLMIIAWWPKLISGGKPTGPARPVKDPSTQKTQSLQIEFEKIQASTENIFRYYLQIDKDGVLSVQIDDIKNNRHVKKKKPVDQDYLRKLSEVISNAKFSDLSDEYSGTRQKDLLETVDISVTIGTKTHRSKVTNRVEPEPFQTVRERIEECGKNELGLVAIQYSADKLTEMARESYLLGCKLFEERQIKDGNLSAAIKALNEAEWCLETVDPKPDFFNKILALASDCQRDLNQRFDDQNFRAQRAIKLEQWAEADKELQIMLEMIPDSSDPRHKEAKKTKLAVEMKLNSK